MASAAEALLSAMAEPLAELAEAQGVALSELQQVVEEAYFACVNRSRTVARTAERLGISRRKACQISKRVKARPNTTELDVLRAFATGEVRTERAVARATRLKPDVVSAAVTSLLHKGHLGEARGGYRLARAFTRLVSADTARLATGLSDSLRPVSRVVLNRLAERPNATGIARVVVFPAPRQTVERHVDLLLAELMTTARTLDEAASNVAERVECAISIFVAVDHT